MVRKEMTTYRRADGQLIGEGYEWVTELEWFEDDPDLDEPIELVETKWVAVSETTRIVEPEGITWCYECDEEPCGWFNGKDGWRNLCPAHGAQYLIDTAEGS